MPGTGRRRILVPVARSGGPRPWLRRPAGTPRSGRRPLALQILSFAAGLLLLYVGAEGLVRGAASLALRFGIAPLVVGLTVVAFGTSTPELVVSVLAGLRGSGDVAVGNVVGSNIFNVGAVLGCAALVRALDVHTRLVVREIPLMIAFSATLPLLAWDGAISRLDGGLLLVGFVGYLAFVLRTAREGPPPGAPAAAAASPGDPAPGRPPTDGSATGEDAAHPEASGVLLPDAVPVPSSSAVLDATLLLLGLAGLVAGGHLLVSASVEFARALGVPELVVGLTVVAAGTSLPELATSVVAAGRGETDIAVGNVVGSNVFNLGAILGTAAVVTPLRADPGLLRLEIPVMVGLALLVLPLGLTDRALRRGEGAALLVIYLGFLTLLVLRAT